jgi:hypothetical protein
MGALHYNNTDWDERFTSYTPTTSVIDYLHVASSGGSAGAVTLSAFHLDYQYYQPLGIRTGANNR